MKKTKKQYLPQVMFKKYRAGEWCNSLPNSINNKRFADSLEEAREAIEYERKYWDEESKGVHRKQKSGMISVEIEPTKDDTFEIVATRIRVREITEWEDVE